MTVSMSVMDDDSSSVQEAETPFEIGVLQDGKPVARKTKMFRKSFSVGRATDNRVVIQKDDTVHRYHVVIRPAVEGKEWWLEVSPTASNRTRLNGKDLRPGGRYRVPGRFRLQLGEATEVRGRLSKKKAA
jgi:pSer/pThr/pTyr-binding forkhead associated (FHA) protein